ncbi:MAG: hypothetical protein J0I57_12410, partial [Hyphomicrobium sp.]|nr:hypothetical protein [Hyphomicrobium sp.]
MASEVGRAAGSRRPLALTMGDPAGIGLDITLLAWRDRVRNGLPPFVLYADPTSVAERARTLGLAVDLAVSEDIEAGRDAFATRLPVRPVPLAVPVVAGRTEMLSAGGIIAAIDFAVADAVAGRRVGDPVHTLVGIVCQIEELVRPVREAVHVFPVLRSHHADRPVFVIDDDALCFRQRSAAQDGSEAPARLLPIGRED